MPSIKQRVIANRKTVVAPVTIGADTYHYIPLDYIKVAPKPATDTRYCFKSAGTITAADKCIKSIEATFRIDGIPETTIGDDNAYGFISVEAVDERVTPATSIICPCFYITREYPNGVIAIHIKTNRVDTENDEIVAKIYPLDEYLTSNDKFHTLRYTYNSRVKSSIVELDGVHVWSSRAAKWAIDTEIATNKNKFNIYCNFSSSITAPVRPLAVYVENIKIETFDKKNYKFTPILTVKETETGSTSISDLYFASNTTWATEADSKLMKAVDSTKIKDVLEDKTTINYKTRMIGKKTNTDTDKVVYSTVNTYN